MTQNNILLISGAILPVIVTVIIGYISGKRKDFNWQQAGDINKIVMLYALPLSIFLSLTSGPTGEELGWRGFMREEFNKKYGFLKSSVCQGLVWCFWHTLLWVVDSEFTDWRAIPYVISNIVVITSITVLMNIFLERHNNLLYSVLLHFGFNILYVFLDADIGFFVILTVLYLVITPIAVLARNKTAEGLLKKNNSGERNSKEWAI